jgi:hypothetical protein
LTLWDQPALRTGDTVTYSLQLKCNKEGNGTFNANIGGILDNASDSDEKGASLNVREIAPERGTSSAAIRDFVV